MTQQTVPDTARAALETPSHPWSVHLVQAGRLEQHSHAGKPYTTAIYRRPLNGPVQVDRYGLEGDEHTGDGPDVDRAVCIHPLAHYAFWRAYFRREIPDGFFGENLTVAGLLDEELCVGDLISCGTTLLEITQPRTPCYKQDRKLGVTGFSKLLLQTGKIGFLARVLQPGVISPGDAFQLVERPHPEANLVFINRMLYDRSNLDAARELAALAPLAHDWKAKFAARTATDG